MAILGTENLNGALAQAQSICWDEGYGYTLGGTAASHADGVDCSGLVWRCLKENGFDMPTTRFGTSQEGAILVNAGFTEIPYSSSYVPKHGDIVVMNHYVGGSVTHGHTTFICENITAYTDASADSANTAVIPLAKVEASSSRGHTAQGDSKKNGTGAYWEVWCHKYNNLFQPYDPGTGDGYLTSEVFIYRWEQTPTDILATIGAILGLAAVLPVFIMLDNGRKRRKKK